MVNFILRKVKEAVKMTNQEVLDIFVSCATLDCEHCNMSFRGCEDKSRFNEMRDMAISALEKQVAKKPREHYNWCDLSEDEKLETPRWYCESCDGVIEENYSYCHDCGQAIDWGGQG
jgi:hypothetical protein